MDKGKYVEKGDTVMSSEKNWPTFGFIGTGNMGGALVRAVCRRVPGERVFLSNRTHTKAAALASELGCMAEVSNQAVASKTTYIFLGVKPQGMAEMLADIAPTLRSRKDRFVLVNIAAGWGIEDIQAMAGANYPVILLKPNTPAAVGEGMSLYLSSPEVTQTEEAVFLDALEASGRLSPLPEKLMDIGGVLAGCGPAFVDLFIEALADGGVACGLSRAQAVEFAAQMVAGSARLVLESGKHPGELKDAVCSPGGVTIQGVRQLEASGFRSAVMEAVIAAYEKNRSLT